MIHAIRRRWVGNRMGVGWLVAGVLLVACSPETDCSLTLTCEGMQADAAATASIAEPGAAEGAGDPGADDDSSGPIVVGTPFGVEDGGVVRDGGLVGDGGVVTDSSDVGDSVSLGGDAGDGELSDGIVNVDAGAACVDCDGICFAGECVVCVASASTGFDQGCDEAAPHCVENEQCVECISDDDCGSGVCVENACAACDPSNHQGCEDSSVGVLCKAGDAPSERQCVACLVELSTRAGTTPCGNNDSGVLEQVCNGGAWLDTETCVEADDCANDETRAGETPCGLNARGVLEQMCTDGAWGDTATCDDPDECVDDLTPVPGTTPCGLNGRGLVDRVCQSGQWEDTGTCDDPDECEDGDTNEGGGAACGFNGRGAHDQFCLVGQWQDDICYDPDECFDGASELTETECGHSGYREESCVQGQFVDAGCVECEREITFPDPNLEAVVREALGIATGPILPEDVVEIQSLDADQSGVTTLDALECFSWLSSLHLDTNGVTSLAPLQNLERLSSLYLRDNAVSDLSPIADLDLRMLHLQGNDIEDDDLVHIGGHFNLYYLALDDNLITDLTSIAGLTNLETLFLPGNQITSLTPLSAMTKLVRLVITDNAVTDLSPLSPLTQLEHLFAANNQITVLNPLSGMTNMRELYLSGNQLVQISQVAGMTELVRLYVDENAVAAFPDLQNLTKLTHLNAGANALQTPDLVPLVDLTAAVWLSVHDNPQVDCTSAEADAVRDAIAGTFLCGATQ